MLSHADLLAHLFWLSAYHTHSSRTPAKAFRKADGKTPYEIHPIWCAMTILHEMTLPEEIRTRGAIVLLYHDVLEDTTAVPTFQIDEITREQIEQMTFASNAAEMEEVWDRPRIIWLYKLYDKVSNLMSSSFMDSEKIARHKAYLRRLVVEVEKDYPELNIIKLAKALL